VVLQGLISQYTAAVHEAWLLYVTSSEAH